MIGAELKAIRARMGLKQTELAERLRIAGNTVARMERDEQVITPPMELLILYVAREAGVDVSSHARGGRPAAALKKAGRPSAGSAAGKSRSRSGKNIVSGR